MAIESVNKIVSGKRGPSGYSLSVVVNPIRRRSHVPSIVLLLPYSITCLGPSVPSRASYTLASRSVQICTSTGGPDVSVKRCLFVTPGHYATNSVVVEHISTLFTTETAISHPANTASNSAGYTRRHYNCLLPGGIQWSSVAYFGYVHTARYIQVPGVCVLGVG